MKFKILQKIYDRFYHSAMILLYHRVADVSYDPHLLSVGKKKFYDQMEFLSKNFKVISLSQLVDDITNRRIVKNSVVITFDDGYADNLLHALPIIKKFSLPVTFFITAGYIDSNKPFYWDELTPEKERGRCLTGEELRKLANFNKVEIGSHSLTHPHLSHLDYSEQKKEINSCKKILEGIIGKPLLSFAYPFGSENDLDGSTEKIVKQSGYKYACANIPDRVNSGSNKYRLPRFLIRNWNIDEFKNNIKNFV